MKKIRLLMFVFIVAFAFTACSSDDGKKSNNSNTDGPNEVRFSRGVNLTEWFQTNSAQSIPFKKFTRETFENIKSLGADVIRFPTNLNYYTSGAPNYTIDPIFLKLLDSPINWAEELGMYIILDNHSFDPAIATDDNIEDILLSVWEQMATRYKDRTKYIIYEILNEPHGIDADKWGEIQGRVIEKIRSIDTVHSIIVTGSLFGSIAGLEMLPEYDDSDIIYSFHFYEPYIFTHQGADWGDNPPYLTDVKNIPFPENIREMPPIPESVKGSWIAGVLNDYPTKDQTIFMESELDKAVAFAAQRNAKVFCGEFGVYMPTSNDEDRVRWYQATREMLDARNIPWTSWDYYGGFGLFKDRQGGDFYSDLNVGVVKALGFTPPSGSAPKPQPESDTVILYDDYPAENITMRYWSPQSTFNLYGTDAKEGDYALLWGNCSLYNSFGFEFLDNRNIQKQVDENYVLEFWAKTDSAINVQVRFVNPEENGNLPWRMAYNLDKTLLPADGEWHKVRLSLKSFWDAGAWEDATQTWHEPENKFTWKKVKNIEFASDNGEMFDTYILFDEMRITK